MKKSFFIVDDIIRFPLTLINYLCFWYIEIPEYTRDRIQLVLLATVLATFGYWSPLIFKNYITFFNTGLDYLSDQLPHDKDSNGGLIFEYQALVAGILAIIAGSFALMSPALGYFFDRRKTRREFIIRVRSWAITTNVEVNALLNSENPLNHYNLESLIDRRPTFLKKDFYWSLSDEHAYLADSIENKITAALNSLLTLKEREDDNIKLVRLDLALNSLCSALIDADNFMAGSLEGHLQIIEFHNNPRLEYFIERNKSPVYRFLHQMMLLNKKTGSAAKFKNIRKNKWG